MILTWANFAIVCTGLLSAGFGVLITLQAIEARSYGSGFLKLLLGSSPVSLGTYFTNDGSWQVVAATWSFFCICVFSIVIVEVVRKIPAYLRNNPYKREIDTRDFDR